MANRLDRMGQILCRVRDQVDCSRLGRPSEADIGAGSILVASLHQLPPRALLRMSVQTGDAVLPNRAVPIDTANCQNLTRHIQAGIYTEAAILRDDQISVDLHSPRWRTPETERRTLAARNRARPGGTGGFRLNPEPPCAELNGVCGAYGLFS